MVSSGEAVARETQTERAEVRLQRLIGLILEAAIDVIACDGATVSVRHHGRTTTVKSTDVRFVHIDEAQYEARSGPCIAAMDADGPVLVTDFDDDRRWANVADIARSIGVHSSLSVRVAMEEGAGLVGSLNLYADDRHHFDEAAARSGEMFASQLGAVLDSARMHDAMGRVCDQLAEALTTRAVIDQAKGMLMHEHKIDADEAFDRLRRASQDQNVKVNKLAHGMVDAAARGDQLTL
jgi:transcriptional regulator with GAF, ATPase, and Fis domain